MFYRNNLHDNCHHDRGMNAREGIFDETPPIDIDDHFRRFGKEPWDVDYNKFGYCTICNTRIDEFGFCSCGGSAD